MGIALSVGTGRYHDYQGLVFEHKYFVAAIA
jgi:hypothetical protein